MSGPEHEDHQKSEDGSATAAHPVMKGQIDKARSHPRPEADALQRSRLADISVESRKMDALRQGLDTRHRSDRHCVPPLCQREYRDPGRAPDPEHYTRDLHKGGRKVGVGLSTFEAGTYSPNSKNVILSGAKRARSGWFGEVEGPH